VLRARRHALLATLLAAGALAAPAAAQTPGDEQYSDPFGGGQEEQSGDTGANQSQEPAEPAPGPAEPAQEPPAPDEPSAAPAQSEPEPQLPYTGLPAGVVAAAGALLLAGGVALRRRDHRRT